MLPISVMSRLLCVLLFSYVLSDEIRFDLKQISIPAYDDDCSTEVMCKNNKASYSLEGSENELRVSLHSDFELTHANCTFKPFDNSTIPIATNQLTEDKNISRPHEYFYTTKIEFQKVAKSGHLKCNFMNCKKKSSQCFKETDNLLESTCVGNIVKQLEEAEDEQSSPVNGYISIIGVLPLDGIEASTTLIDMEEHLWFSIKCYDDCKGNKFKGKITLDEDTSNSTSKSVVGWPLTENGIDTYESPYTLNRNGSKYSCIDDKKKIRTFILDTVKNKDAADVPKVSPFLFIAGVMCIVLLVIMGLVLLYKRWKIVSNESKAKIKKSSTQSDDNLNLNPNRVSYVELDFDQNVNSNFVPEETTQYATVIGVMAPREPADTDNEEN